MASSLLNLVDNFEEGVHKTKCKDCNCFLVYESVKDNLIKYKFLSCNKYYSNKLDEKSKKNKFKNIYFAVKKRCLSLSVHGWLGKV